MRRTYAPNRVREVRKSRGMSQEALGGEMRQQLTGATIAKLEGSHMALSLDYLVEMSRVLQVPPSELIAPGGMDVRMAPVIGLVAAGNWREAVELSDEFMPIPGHLTGRNLYILRPEGDSMDKLVPSGFLGGFIVVDPDDRELLDGKCYVVMNEEGETTFKRFSADPLQLVPCSSNPAHQPIPLGSEPFLVVGRVVYVGQEL